jgi:hypothetical protein
MRVSHGPLVARFGAAIAAAAIAVSGAAVANASTTPAKVPTALTAEVAHVVNHPHATTAVVFGQLTAPATKSPLRGLVVWLARENAGGKWHLVAGERTNRHGYVAFHVRVAKAANFALVFRGNKNFAESKSPVVTVTHS